MFYVLLSYIFSPVLYAIIFLRGRKPLSKVLVIQTAKIGDLICSTPVFREIKKAHPASHLTVVIDPATRELVENNPHVDEIKIINKGDLDGLAGKLNLAGYFRRSGFDAAICLNPNVPYAISLLWGLVPVRLSVEPDFPGTTFKFASVFFTKLEKHVRGNLTIETYMNMLRATGVKSGNMTKEVYRSENAEARAREILGSIATPLIGIAVSSGNKMKELGTEKITALTDKIIKGTECTVVLVGSKEDRKTAHTIAESLGASGRIVNAAGSLTLAELPALIEKFALYIGVDSGITYMADALSIPLINIAGPADMQDQRPTGENVVIIQKKLACVPCSHAFKSPYHCRLNTRECITSVTVEEIYSAVEKMLPGGIK